MTALASILDVEAVSRPVPPADRARVARLIELVSADVAGYTGQTFVEATSTVTVHPHDGVVRLPQHPVTAVTELRQVGRVLAPATYEWDPAGYVRRRWNSNWAYDSYGDSVDTFDGAGPYDPTGAPLDEWGWPAAPLTVTYTHGYPTGGAPDDIRMVIAERTAKRWTFGAEDVQAEAIDGYNVHYQKETHGMAWSPEHKAILDRYRRSRLASVRLS